MKLLSSLVVLLLVFLSLSASTSIVFAQEEQQQQQSSSSASSPSRDESLVNDNNKIDSSRCRDLGFASPHSNAPPSCGTCDVLKELLKATDEEKRQLSDAKRKENKEVKKQF